MTITIMTYSDHRPTEFHKAKKSWETIDDKTFLTSVGQSMYDLSDVKFIGIKND